MTVTLRNEELLVLADECDELARNCRYETPFRRVLLDSANALRLAAKPDEDGPLLQLAEWCRIEREKIGAIDGYDYRSGEEFGLRRAQNEIERRTLSTTGEPKR